jgi:putative aldouronate transport system substrate-binding protein
MTYLRLINTQLTEETQKDWVSILPPASSKGASVPRLLEIPEFGAVLTMKNKDIPRSLRWIDAQMEPDTMLISVNGPMDSSAGIEPTLMINDEGKYEVIYVPEDNGLYKVVPVYHGQFFAPGDFIFNIFVMPPHRVERFETSKAYEDAGVLEKNSYNILQKLIRMTSDEATEQQYRFDTIEMLMKETITSFITNGVTDASWDDFITKSRAAGVDAYIETYQKAYDDYIASSR